MKNTSPGCIWIILIRYFNLYFLLILSYTFHYWLRLLKHLHYLMITYIYFFLFTSNNISLILLVTQSTGQGEEDLITAQGKIAPVLFFQTSLQQTFLNGVTFTSSADKRAVRKEKLFQWREKVPFYMVKKRCIGRNLKLNLHFTLPLFHIHFLASFLSRLWKGCSCWALPSVSVCHLSCNRVSILPAELELSGPRGTVPSLSITGGKPTWRGSFYRLWWCERELVWCHFFFERRNVKKIKKFKTMKITKY